jgi:hypothetical protein
MILAREGWSSRPPRRGAAGSDPEADRHGAVPPAVAPSDPGLAIRDCPPGVVEEVEGLLRDLAGWLRRATSGLELGDELFRGPAEGPRRSRRANRR